MNTEKIFSSAGVIIAAFFICCAPRLSGEIPVVRPIIISTIPHDTLSFTQGLFYDSGRLYESAGLYGKSSLRVVDASNGMVIKNQPINKSFAEGCALLGSELYQLTWQEQFAYVYSFPGLEEKRTVIYAGEGWGLTSGGNLLYMSNGTDTLYERDKGFAVVRKIAVTLNGRPQARMNELEYANGMIYANVWYADYILEINPKNGKTVRKIDCSELIKKEMPANAENVLNGIAHNPRNRQFYITGKNWKSIFIVAIPQK